MTKECQKIWVCIGIPSSNLPLAPFISFFLPCIIENKTHTVICVPYVLYVCICIQVAFVFFIGLTHLLLIFSISKFWFQFPIIFPHFYSWFRRDWYANAMCHVSTNVPPAIDIPFSWKWPSVQNMPNSQNPTFYFYYMRMHFNILLHVLFISSKVFFFF